MFGIIVIISAVITISLLVYLFLLNTRIIGYEVVKSTYKNDILTVTYKSGKQEVFKGSRHIWYWYPSMKRCATRIKIANADLYRWHREHGDTYPKIRPNKYLSGL